MTWLPSLLLAVLFAATPRLVYRALGLKTRLQADSRTLLGAAVLFGTMLAWSDLFGREVALGLGVAACLALGLVALVRGRRFAKIERLTAELRGDDAAAALSRLDEEVRALLPNAKRRRKYAAAWTLFVVERALAAGHAARALGWLDALQAAPIPEDLVPIAAQYRASVHLRLGDPEAARRALDGLPRPVRAPNFEAALRATEALIDVLRGDLAAGDRADEALATKLEANLRLHWQSVRAHALAVRRADTDLEALLPEMYAAGGHAALDRLVAHRGPASAAAERFLAARGPYR